MRTLSAADFLKTAMSTAHHYGFVSVDRLKDHVSVEDASKKIEHRSTAIDRKIDNSNGMLTSGMTQYFNYRLNTMNKPILFYSVEQVPRSGDVALSLQIFNVKKSIAEALLIQTIRSMLGDLGYDHYSVRVNSLGDADSVSRYIRELSNFLRRRISDMPLPARELMKEHALMALMHLIEKNHDLVGKSPNPLEYLTDASRKHFREIVEYLDMSSVPYEIDPTLVGHHQCYSEALFEFDLYEDENRETTLKDDLNIRGGRYNAFVSRMSRTDISAVGAVIALKDKKILGDLPVRRDPIPSVYMIQLGFGPKIRSLCIIDELRRAGIIVYQNVASDSLSEQLREAEAKSVRYAVIVGQKEYVDGTAIVRDLKEQCQESVSQKTLISRLRKVAA